MEGINLNKTEDGPSVPDENAEKGLRLINDIKNYTQTLEELNGKLEDLKESTLSSVSYFDTEEIPFSAEELEDTSDTEMKAQESYFKVESQEEAQEKIKAMEGYVEDAQKALKAAQEELDSLLKN